MENTTFVIESRQLPKIGATDPAVSVQLQLNPIYFVPFEIKAQ